MTPVTFICILTIILLIISFVYVSKYKDYVSAHAPYVVTKQSDGFHISLTPKDVKGYSNKAQEFPSPSMLRQRCQCIVVFAEANRDFDSSGKPQSSELSPSEIHCFDCKGSLNNNGD